ncbi:hypothetical protein ACHAQH_003537 [Verticillium albo-atrum]
MLRRRNPPTLIIVPRILRAALPRHWTRSFHAGSSLTFRLTSIVPIGKKMLREGESYRFIQDTTCNVCHAEQTPSQMAAMPPTRKGRGLYEMRTVCDACWATLYERAGVTQKQNLLRRQAAKAASDAMEEGVRAIDAYEAVPIRYAVEKLAESRIERPAGYPAK